MLFLFSVELISYNNKIFKLDKGKRILILGDSHTECAINDTVFSESENFSRSAEAYIYTFSKVKKLLKENQQITTVILGFSFHNLFNYSWFNNKVNLMRKLNSYGYFMNKSELFNLLKVDPVDFIEAVFSIEKGGLIAAVNSLSNDNYKVLDLGSYFYLIRNKVDVEIEKRKNGQIKNPIETSSLQVTYLLKIADYCKEENVKLILISTPIHKYLYYNSEFWERYYFNFYSQNLKKFKLFDYSTLSLPDSCFGDLTHLNYKGARIFSKILKKDFETYMSTGNLKTSEK